MFPFFDASDDGERTSPRLRGLASRALQSNHARHRRAVSYERRRHGERGARAPVRRLFSSRKKKRKKEKTRSSASQAKTRRDVRPRAESAMLLRGEISPLGEATRRVRSGRVLGRERTSRSLRASCRPCVVRCERRGRVNVRGFPRASDETASDARLAVKKFFSARVSDVAEMRKRKGRGRVRRHRRGSACDSISSACAPRDSRFSY